MVRGHCRHLPFPDPVPVALVPALQGESQGAPGHVHHAHLRDLRGRHVVDQPSPVTCRRPTVFLAHGRGRVGRRRRFVDLVLPRPAQEASALADSRGLPVGGVPPWPLTVPTASTISVSRNPGPGGTASSWPQGQRTTTSTSRTSSR